MLSLARCVGFFTFFHQKYGRFTSVQRSPKVETFFEG
jgi:hypothetical protein